MPPNDAKIIKHKEFNGYFALNLDQFWNMFRPRFDLVWGAGFDQGWIKFKLSLDNI